MKFYALVGGAASFFLLLTEFTCLITKRLQQNKRYSGTHDLKGNAQNRKRLSYLLRIERLSFIEFY
jgi:hypothetical protein